MTNLEALRERFRPAIAQVVFVGESAPDPRDGERRFFYLPELSAHDNLFRGIMIALYGADRNAVSGRKAYWLGRFQSDGYWLLDLAPRPINHLSSAERAEAILANVPRLVQRLKEVEPAKGVIICKSSLYATLTAPIRSAGIRVLHGTPVPFPLPNVRQRFVEDVRRALKS